MTRVSNKLMLFFFALALYLGCLVALAYSQEIKCEGSANHSSCSVDGKLVSETVCDGNGCRSEANSEGLTKKKLSKKRQQKLDAEIAEMVKSFCRGASGLNTQMCNPSPKKPEAK